MASRARFDPAIDRNEAGLFRAGHQPGRHLAAPTVRLLNLVTIIDLLAKEPEFVVDAVGVTGHTHGRERIQRARCQAAQTTIAKSGIDLLVKQQLQVDSVSRQKFAAMINNAEVKKIVLQRAAYQVLKREIIKFF